MMTATHQETDVFGGILLESIRGQGQTKSEGASTAGARGPSLEGDAGLSVGISRGISRLCDRLLQAFGVLDISRHARTHKDKQGDTYRATP